jgi:hypothetical protein
MAWHHMLHKIYGVTCLHGSYVDGDGVRLGGLFWSHHALMTTIPSGRIYFFRHV